LPCPETNIWVAAGFDGTESIREERDYKINVSVLSGNIGNKKKNSDNDGFAPDKR